MFFSREDRRVNTVLIEWKNQSAVNDVLQIALGVVSKYIIGHNVPELTMKTKGDPL